MAFVVRQAEAADRPKLPLIYEADGYDRAAAGMRKRAGWEVRGFRAGRRLLFFAEADGEPVGTVGLVFRGKDAGYADGRTSANIHRLHVVIAHRRQGVATALMTAAEEEARHRGFRSLTVEVEDDNAPARALYEKLGFQYTGPGHAANEIAMAKELQVKEGQWKAQRSPA
jgi:ribosomal protein S18 acetylase RimI-like enzyme